MRKFYEIQFEIETNCLLDCIHCSSLNSRSLDGIEYSMDDILNMMKLFDEKSHIVFTGGEPFLNDSILQLINKIDKQKKIGIYTTGNLNNLSPIESGLANKLKKYGVDECYFSIYSSSCKEHEELTRIEGSFLNTLKSIESLKKNGIVVKGHLVLTKKNIDKIEDVLNFCEQIELDEVRILKLAPVGNAKNNWNDLSISLGEQNRVIEGILAKNDNYKMKITVAGYPTIMPCRNFDGAKGCQAGTNLLYVDAYGDIYPCASTKSNKKHFKICNIKELYKLRVYLDKVSNIEYRKICLSNL
jgi:radical SAM domain protein